MGRLELDRAAVPLDDAGIAAAAREILALHHETTVRQILGEDRTDPRVRIALEGLLAALPTEPQERDRVLSRMRRRAWQSRQEAA